MAPHSSTLAWKTPWMEEPGRLQSMEQRDLLAICQVFGFLSDCRLMFLDFIFCGFILKCLLGSKTYLDGKVEMEVSG